MSNDSLFAFIPQIKPYQVIPSEDDPKEYILLLEENGASLGINHTERRLIELCDGRLAVGDIVLSVMRDSSARVTDIRRLLWDLDRFGFLESSPWEEHKLPESWGYWGTKKQPLAHFYYSTIFGGVERGIVRFALQPIVLLLQFLVLAAIFVGSFYIQLEEAASIWSDTRILIVNQSVALGVLVVLFGILAALFVSAWAGASVISAVHESPVGMALFWQSPFFRLMLDGRPLRSLPIKKAILAALIPSFKLFGIAALLSLLGAFSEGVRREWLLHLSLAFAVTSFGILIPWFSTVVSRDIVLRLRGDSVFWMTWRAVRKSFQSLFQSTKENVLHEQLFLWWGVWAIVSMVIVLRVAATLFRADFPILYSHILQENNALILWIFIIVSSILLIGVAGAVITFVWWLFRELYTEIRLRAFPQYDITLAIVIPLLFMILAALCISSDYHFSPVFLQSCTWIVGLVVTGFGIKQLMKERKGLPAKLHISVVLIGVLVLLGVLDKLVFHSVLQQNSVLNLSIILIALLLCLPVFSSRIVLDYQKLLPKYWFLLMVIFVATILYHVFLIQGEVLFNILGREVSYIVLGIDIRYGLLCVEVLPFILMTRSRSLLGVIPIPIVAILPFYMEGLRVNPSGDLYLVTLLFIPGALISTYILYYGNMARVEQSFSSSSKQSITEGSHKTIHQAHISSIEKLFQCPVHPSIQQALSDDDLREMLQSPVHPSLQQTFSDDYLREMLLKLNKLFGPNVMQVVFRCAAHQLSWQDTQKLAALMPPTVALPKLSNWDQEKVVSYLRNVPTFMHAGSESNKISSISRFKFYQKDDRIITQNTKENDLHIIVQGKAAVDVEHTFGQTRIAVMSTGDFVGEIGFLSGSERTATVRALEPVMVISVNRDEINDSMPQTLKSIRQAEAGQSWLQSLHQFNIFREFSPALLSRVSLESQHIHLEVSRTLVMHEDANQSCVAVLLSGDAVHQQDGENTRLAQGSIAGIVETMLKQPVQGVIRAERQSHLLLVNHELFSSALIELLTPKQMLLPVLNQEN